MGFDGAGGFHPTGGGGYATQEELVQKIADMKRADSALHDKIINIENNELKILYYASISETSGQIEVPANATVILKDFPSSIDAVVETIVDGKASGLSPNTKGGSPVTVTGFDSCGNYILSGIPSTFPVALLYVFKIKAIYYSSNLSFNNIIETQIIDAAPIAYVESKLALRESISNKVATFIGNELSTSKYPSIKAIIDYFSPTRLFTILAAGDWSGLITSGKLVDFIKPVSNNETDETDLFSYTTMANTLAKPGEDLVFTVTGTFNDHRAAVQLKFYFAGINIGDTGVLELNTPGTWVATLKIKRTGASTAISSLNLNLPNSISYNECSDLTKLNFLDNNIIKITGESGKSGDITAKIGEIFWNASAHT